MTITHSTDSRTALALALVTHVGNGGLLNVYDSGANLLLSFELSSAAFLHAGTSATLKGNPATEALETGDVATFKLFTAGGGLVYQGTVTGAGGGGDLELQGGPQVVEGQPVTVSSHSWSVG